MAARWAVAACVAVSAWRGVAAVDGTTSLMAGGEAAAPEYTKEDIEALKGKTLTNLAEVLERVGFTDLHRDPYPDLWYDTKIVENKDCYVVFPSESERSMYELKTLSAEEADAYGEKRAYKTHQNGCGACSSLDDLAVYLGVRDLTSPVRRCSFRVIESRTMSCLRDIGFTEACARIWFWNARNTRKASWNGGCLGVCLLNIFSPNNEPQGGHNPCKPTQDLLNSELQNVGAQAGATGGDAVGAVDVTAQDLPDAPEVDLGSRGMCLPGSALCKNCCLPRGREDDGRCRNTINGRPACSEGQWRNGPYRLNPCLQCDECRSGPIFQKIAARTRRGSFIASAISRPLDPDDIIIHRYD